MKSSNGLLFARQHRSQCIRKAVLLSPFFLLILSIFSFKSYYLFLSSSSSSSSSINASSSSYSIDSATVSYSPSLSSSSLSPPPSPPPPPPPPPPPLPPPPPSPPPAPAPAPPPPPPPSPPPTPQYPPPSSTQPPPPSSSTPSPPSSSSPSSSSTPSSSPSSSFERECDISRGEWVRDPEGPYYTNMTCYHIQEHQNCMKYGRPDTDFLKWRWKPDCCELQRFDPVRFLQIVKGRTLAFVGDSIARNHMQSLMCLLSRVVYPKDISNSSDENFKRMFYPDYNFTILILWSPFLVRAHLADSEGPNGTGLWYLYLDEPEDVWASQIEQFDHVIISGGNWFTRPSMFYEKKKLIGCHYCLVSNVTDLTLHFSHRTAFRTALAAINNAASFNGTVFLRTMSPGHFENGEWNKGGNCIRTRPYRRNETKLEGLDEEFYKAQLEEFSKAEMEGRRRGRVFRLLDTTGAMALRPDGHPSRYGHWAHENVTLYNDCVHWCLPGPIDSWGDFLLHMMSFS